MGSCLSKPQKIWNINPLNYINNTEDICVICHLEISSQNFVFLHVVNNSFIQNV